MLLWCGVMFFMTWATMAQEDSTKAKPEDAKLQVQDTIDAKVKSSKGFQPGKDYVLKEVKINGLNRFSEQTVRVHTGLIENTKIKLPGDKLTSAIKRLYETKQFSKVDVFIAKLEGEAVSLEFDVKELPQLNKVLYKNVKRNKSKTYTEEAKLRAGAMVTENLLVTTKNYFEKKFREEGFLNAKVKISTIKSEKPNTVNLFIDIDKGEKVKIKDIVFHGTEKLSDQRLLKAMKKTKKKKFWRFWKKSKYIDQEYKNDLSNIIDVYSERGYRDAIITKKDLTRNDGNTITLDIYIDEGKQYRFGNISFVGNTVYTDEQLRNFLHLDKGDVYNAKVLNERVLGDGTPESEDISSFYLNNGYLFSRVTPVETRVHNDSIDVEVRIYEDEPATIRKITVNGNDQTNDHVIYRELWTKPGDLFSKESIVRSIRELSQLGFFDPEAISPNLKPNQLDKTVDIDYTVAEKGSSQIELQGGYGGRSFIGTLGLSFNNFSMRNIFNKKAYTPVPMGDGQSLSLRLQKSKFYSTYSFSFTEPWLGGRKPKSLSMSVYNSQRKGIDYGTFEALDNQGMSIWGASLGLGQRLKWPDDYFQLTQSIGFQRYELNNYKVIRTLPFSDGVANNISYNIVFSRNSSGPNPIYPMGGSELSVSLKATPPFSLLNNKDYTTIDDKEKYKWLEYYKTSFKARWFVPLYEKLVLMAGTEFGALGYYNKDIGYSPFERFVVGGDGMAQNFFDGSETIALRGYEYGALSGRDEGGTVYNKFIMEARYPITLKPQASIYVAGFLEAGNSFPTFEKFNPFVLKRSAGLGVRIFMPQFGLLGIDFAHGFDENPVTGEKSGWQTHFVLGQQF
ncbi:MAG: outer membrane protein assembly factor BamA [Flavobacteriia bacterium]|nr:MAG: outer membrane protein assembly factor BamA [Flavobacteriia bacterium]